MGVDYGSWRRGLCAAAFVGAALAIGPAAAAPADYDLGYRDGYNNQAYRDRYRRNQDYGEGYRAGEAQRRSGGTAPADSDYDQGYRDGYQNRPYRDRDRSSKPYRDGYRAGEARRIGGNADAGSDYDTGYRDGLHGLPLRDRNNLAYGRGYSAGETERRAGGAVSGGSDYDLGYADGYNRRAARDRTSRAYAEGYRAGEQARRGQPAPGIGVRPPSAAWQPRTETDLLGRRAADADSGMRALGFSKVGESGGASESYSTWSSSARCLRVTVRNGVVAAVNDLPGSECPGR